MFDAAADFSHADFLRQRYASAAPCCAPARRALIDFARWRCYAPLRSCALGWQLQRAFADPQRSTINNVTTGMSGKNSGQTIHQQTRQPHVRGTHREGGKATTEIWQQERRVLL